MRLNLPVNAFMTFPIWWIVVKCRQKTGLTIHFVYRPEKAVILNPRHYWNIYQLFGNHFHTCPKQYSLGYLFLWDYLNPNRVEGSITITPKFSGFSVGSELGAFKQTAEMFHRAYYQSIL